MVPQPETPPKAISTSFATLPFAPPQAYWIESSQANRDILRNLLASQTTLFSYTDNPNDTPPVSADDRNLDDLYLARQINNEILLNLSLDYQSNVTLYRTVQSYLRKKKMTNFRALYSTLWRVFLAEFKPPE